MSSTTERYLRLPQVLSIVPVCRATWYAGIKEGRYPAPVKLGPRAVAWQLSDIEKLIASFEPQTKEFMTPPHAARGHKFYIEGTLKLHAARLLRACHGFCRPNRNYRSQCRTPALLCER